MSFRPFRFVCTFADRLIAFQKSLSLLLLALNLSVVKADEDGLSTVQNLVIPQFNEDGHLSWELHASQVKAKGQDIFITSDPILYLYTTQTLELTARSVTGEFFLETEQARGTSLLAVVGNGFSANGHDWRWNSFSAKGRNQMIFKRNSKVVFTSGLGDFFVDDLAEKNSICDLDQKEEGHSTRKSPTIPTVALGNYLELISKEESSHLFLLEGNVSIEGDNLFLTCEKVEVLFHKDGNTTNTEIGSISQMDAGGNVVLKQGARTSYAENMALDVKLGTVLLTGQARVVDDEWGEARGERIILEKGNRRARVLGNESVRPRLELPALPDFGFRKKAKKKTQ